MERFRNRRAGGPGRLAEPPIGSAEAAAFGVVQRPPKSSPRPLLPPRGSTARLKNDGKPCRAGQENRSGFCRKALPFGRLRRPSPERQPSRETGTMRWDRRCSQLEKQIGPRVDATDCVQPRFSHSTSSGSRGRRKHRAAETRVCVGPASSAPVCVRPRFCPAELRGDSTGAMARVARATRAVILRSSHPRRGFFGAAFAAASATRLRLVRATPTGFRVFDRVPRRTPLRGK